MKFKVKRSSVWNDDIAPCDEAIQERYTRFETSSLSNYEEFDERFGANEGRWLSKGTNHCINKWNIQREIPNGSTGWFLKINTLDELMSFQSKYGEIIIAECSDNPNITEIEIYDDYIE